MKFFLLLLMFMPLLAISQVTSDTMTLMSFSDIQATGKIKVTLHFGEPQLYMTGDANFDVNDVEIKLKKSKLKISLIKGDYKDREPVVHVYCKSFESLRAMGNADITSAEIWGDTDNVSNKKTNIWQVELDAQVGGHIQLDVRSMFVEANVNQGGTITLSGRSETAKYSVKTGGTIGAIKLDADEVEASVTAGGEIYLSARNVLDAKTNAGGAIYYMPTNAQIDKNITLGGKIKGLDASGKVKPEEVEK